MAICLGVQESSYAQDQGFDSATVEELLCKKWQIDKILVKGQPLKENIGMKTMTFHSDHRLEISGAAGEVSRQNQEYTWSYEEGSQAIRINKTGEGNWPPVKLLKISENECEMEIQPGQIVYFVPAK